VAAFNELRQRDESLVGAQLSWGGAGRGGDVGEAFDKGGDGVAVSCEGGSLVVGEVELLEHGVDSFFNG